MSVPTLPLANEDHLNLTSSIVSLADGNQRILDGKNLTRIAGNIIPEILATIPSAILDVLYAEVSGNCTSAKDCLTALRFYFVAESQDGTKVMKLYYEPLFLTFDNTDSASGEREYSVVKKGNIHSYNGSALSTVSDTELQAAQSLFEGEATLKHSPTAASFTAFKQGADATSGVLPFQTIFALLNDNAATEFMINNCAVIDATATPEVKQTLILKTAQNSDSGAFAGKFANRLDNEPPFTNSFKYTVV